ncbi:MAG: hypothetical protein Q7U82_15835 [Gammaproteobacteria bacterium]|nr:hypothetical protein [Gammaproteobacteria bacterium]
MHFSLPLQFFRSLTGALSALLFLAGCSEPATEPNATAATDSDTAPVAFDTSLNMRDFMNLILDPAADVLWDSAGWVDSRETGYEELYPTTDEQWDYVRRHAALIIEIGNMLALPGRAVDNDAWLTYANGLSQAGALAMEAAAVQNEEDFFQAGAQLYSVCTACHQSYNPEITSKFATN